MKLSVMKILRIAKKIGWKSTFKYIWLSKGLGIFSGFSIQPVDAKYPVFLRTKSSDINIFDAIFIESEYQPLEKLEDIEFIIDAGANIGLASVFFLSYFPNSTVVAVEPDPENFHLLEKNLLPYGARARLIHGGLWSRPTRLTVETGVYRDGGAWATQVREANDGEKSTISAVDVQTIMKESDNQTISILKMDIEGAEVNVLSDNYHGWIEKVKNLCVELHDDSYFGNATEAFNVAIQDQDFKVVDHGELKFCLR